MKDSTRTTLQDGVSGLVALVIIGTLLIMATTGCAVSRKHEATHAQFKPANNWRPGSRCKTVGQARTSHIAVIVQKDCFRAGLTTVGILVLNPEKKGAVAAEHAVQAVIAILGYRPASLPVIVAGKQGEHTFMLTAVADSTGTVARK